MRFIITMLLLLVIASPSYATWQVANPYQGTLKHFTVNPFIGKTSYPIYFGNHTQYTLTLKQDWLSSNIFRIAAQYHWRVQWLAKTDYPVLTSRQISGFTFPVMMNELLHNYPLKATYDDAQQLLSIQ
jgi:hypothetical protein